MCLYAIVGACALGVNSHMAVHDASHYNPSGVPRYLAAHYISPPIQVGEAVRSAINTQAPWSGRAGPAASFLNRAKSMRVVTLSASRAPLASSSAVRSCSSSHTLLRCLARASSRLGRYS